jgi:serine/threonine protein kinase
MGNEHSTSRKGKQPSSTTRTQRHPLSFGKRSKPMTSLPLTQAEQSTATSKHHDQSSIPMTGTSEAQAMSFRLPLSPDDSVQLGDFELKLTLGTGTFGRVMLAQHRSSHHYVAIKILKKEKVVRLKQMEHVTYEKTLLERIQSVFIVNYVAAFKDCRNLYLVMEYVKGGELFSYLRKSIRFSDEVARFYAAEVILALEHLHNQDIVYRDLKPENILLDHSGHIKITDFGFAKVVKERTWTVCGTPEYLAPEIILNKGYGKSVDWWALGVLIYEMLCGFTPFYDENPYEIYEKIVAGKVRYPSQVNPTAKGLISNLLQVDLTKRYGNLRNGIDDIKNHPWFEGLDWNAFSKLVSKPHYVPKVEDDADSSHFQKYEEEPIVGLPVVYDPYEELFANW